MSLNASSIQQLKCQLSTAESIQSKLTSEQISLQSELHASQKHMLKLSTSLVEQCKSINISQGSSLLITHTPTQLTAALKGELEKLRVETHEQKRSVTRILNTISAAERDFQDIQNCSKDVVERRQKAELERLIQEETSLKEQCRHLRIKLAQCRQKQWYKQPAGLTEKPAVNVPLSPRRVAAHGSPPNKRIAKEAFTPKEFTSPTADESEPTLISAVGAVSTTSTSLSDSVISQKDASTVFECLEARKEANNRQFKFLTNY